MPFSLQSFLYLHAAVSQTGRGSQHQHTVPAFLPHPWPARQPAVMCEWRHCHHPQHGSVKWQGERKRDWERGAILNTGTWMLSRSWQHLCFSCNIFTSITGRLLKSLACCFIHWCCPVKIISSQNRESILCFTLAHLHYTNKKIPFPSLSVLLL